MHIRKTPHPVRSLSSVCVFGDFYAPLKLPFLEVERKRVYAKASQQAARDSLEMQRAANSEVGCMGVCQMCAVRIYVGRLVRLVPTAIIVIARQHLFLRRHLFLPADWFAQLSTSLLS